MTEDGSISNTEHADKLNALEVSEVRELLPHRGGEVNTSLIRVVNEEKRKELERLDIPLWMKRNQYHLDMFEKSLLQYVDNPAVEDSLKDSIAEYNTEERSVFLIQAKRDLLVWQMVHRPHEWMNTYTSDFGKTSILDGRNSETVYLRDIALDRHKNFLPQVASNLLSQIKLTEIPNKGADGNGGWWRLQGGDLSWIELNIDRTTDFAIENAI